MWRLIILFFSIALVVVLASLLDQPDKPALVLSDVLNLEDQYSLKVQPILNGRCVACHSCYNSPCQLNLTSFEGISRGGSKVDIYDFPKLKARSPSRLYIDAHSPEGWRSKGFFPVTDDSKDNILNHMIKGLRGIESGLQEKYDSEDSRVCIEDLSEKAVNSYNKENPAGRMPFGFPGLKSKEISTIGQWIETGSSGPLSQTLEEKVLKHESIHPLIEKWEQFFNGQSLKEKITSRYLYEHLFLASLYFEQHPNIFFRIVRSKSERGPVEEIATVLPYDSPGVNFFYRLRPIVGTLTHKSHIPFLLSDQKQKKWKESLIDSSWSKKPTLMPPYGKAGSNPFTTFQDMPVKGRYEFLIENSIYHIMTFIKGPVCRGQTALNVINDQFWVFFLNQNEDPMVKSPELYRQIAEEIEFPSVIGDDFNPLISFRKKYWKSVESKFSSLSKQPPLDFKSFWNGNNDNPNANVTVFRHFDSATVLPGLRGQTPKTVWVLDFHVLESIYYNLSAGYNVFGPLLHQINSRLFMEVSRVASEDLFLSFLPKKADRLSLRSQWNLKVPRKEESTLKFITDLFTDDAKEKLSKSYPYLGQSVESSIVLQETNKDIKIHFLDKLQKIFSKDQRHPIKNEAQGWEDFKSLPAEIVAHLPDTMLVLLEEEDQIYTLIHNKDHFNVAMMFFEGDRRRPQKDSLDVVEGLASSYANLFMVLNKNSKASFLKRLKTSKNKSEITKTLRDFGVLRSDPQFWSYFDRFATKTHSLQTNERGVIDLNRYINF